MYFRISPIVDIDVPPSAQPMSATVKMVPSSLGFILTKESKIKCAALSMTCLAPMVAFE